MKTIRNNRIKYLLAMIVLIFFAELLLKFDNMIIQCFGICVLPVIAVDGVLLFKNEQKQI